MRKRRQRSEASEPRTDTDPRPENSETLESNERRTRPRRTRASYRQPNIDPPQETAPIPAAPNAEENLDYDLVDSELTCALCHELYINPVASPCGHAFCSLCHLRLFSVRLPGEPGLPPSQRSRPCPLCRQKHKSEDSAPNVQLDTRARTEHPELYARRVIEVAAATEQLNQEQPNYFTLTVGNTCQQTSAVQTRSGVTRQGRSDWEFFVELRDGITGEDVDARVYIDQVVMHLCGGDGRQICTLPPYLVSRSTNGAIRRMCYAIVYFKPETRLQPVAVTWLLNMNPGRHCLDVPLELCRRQGGDGSGGAGGNGSQQDNNDSGAASEGAHFGHFASITGPVARGDGASTGPPGMASREGPAAGLGALYPVLAGLLETFIRMDTVHRRNT